MNIRCWKCGSKNVTVSLSTESKYSVGKGAVGTLLFGTGGAAMGVNGKTSESKRYVCQACGEISSITLSESTCAEIEKALKENDTFALQSKKIFYPNIEWEPAVTAPISETETVKEEIREYSFEDILRMVPVFFMDAKNAGKSFSDSEILALLGLNNKEQLREAIELFATDLLVADAGSLRIDVDEEKFISSLNDDLSADMRYIYSPDGKVTDNGHFIEFTSRVYKERKRIKKEREEAEQQQKERLKTQKRKIADTFKESRITELTPHRKKHEAALACVTCFKSYSHHSRNHRAFLLLNGEVTNGYDKYNGLRDIVKLSGEWALDINGNWHWIREYTSDDITLFKALAEKAREEFDKCGDVKQIVSTYYEGAKSIYFIAVRENGEMVVFGTDAEFDYLKEWKNIEKYCGRGIAIRKSGDLMLKSDNPSIEKWNNCYDVITYFEKCYAVNLDGTIESNSLDIKPHLAKLQFSGEVIQMLEKRNVVVTKSGQVITEDSELRDSNVIAGITTPVLVFVTEDGRLINEHGEIYYENVKLWDDIETVDEDRKQAIKKEQEKRRLEEIRKEEEMRKKAEEQRRAGFRAQKLCQHCGGAFKGFFSKTCTACGKAKDY